MPFIKKIETDEGILGIWELQESVSELEHTFQFSDSEKTIYQKIKFDKRKKEFLSTRLLIELLVGKKVEIIYRSSREPVLKGEKLFLSISHSENVVAVFLSSKCRVGVDAERIDRNIEQVKKRFLSTLEEKNIEFIANQQKATITYWCAKESIFKCTHNQGIQFNRQIFIEPFLLKNEGTFYGKLKLEQKIEEYKLWYFAFKNNMIVYCVPLNVN